MSAEPPPVPVAVAVAAPPTWRDRLDLLLQPAGGPSPATLVAGALAAVVLAALGWFVLRTPAAPPAESLMAPVRSAPTATTPGGALVVHAAGAVARPGVYELRAGARVQDLLAAAGGAAPGAQLDRLNLAAPLVDGSQVYVPREGEAAPPSASGSGAGAPAGPLDLNRATVEQLEELPGVGPATAQAIVAAREELGGFRSVEDLLDVRGIGPAKYEALKDLVTV
jgi:competence protein ComEA